MDAFASKCWATKTSIVMFGFDGLYGAPKPVQAVLTPIKQEYYSKFRLLIMRLIFLLKLDAYPGSISRLV